ncbi:hypothetical protein BDV06DRAFT_28803 [Aspergillus oleicola]
MASSSVDLKEDFLANYEIVERFFNERLSESNPSHRNVKPLLGAVRERISPDYKKLAWDDLAEPYTHFLLKCRRQYPEAFEGFRTEEGWDEFVRRRTFHNLMIECFPSGPVGAGIGLSQRGGMTSVISITRGTTNNPEPGRLVRVLTTGSAMITRLRRLG